LPLDLASHFEKRFRQESFEVHGQPRLRRWVSVNFAHPEPGKPGTSTNHPAVGIGWQTRAWNGSGNSANRRPTETFAARYRNAFGCWQQTFLKDIIARSQTDAKSAAIGCVENWRHRQVDEDDSFTAKGRLSRFSKIGGEMVPHEQLEQKIIDVLELLLGDGAVPHRNFGVQVELKGEALVLLSAVDLAISRAAAKKLQEAGVPNLWIPKKRPPRPKGNSVLASGENSDLARCTEIAKKTQ